MDDREREDSQSRRPSIKRPWGEEYVLPEQVNAWNGTRLPSIDASSCHQPSLPPRVTEPEDIWVDHYGSDSRAAEAKRARYEGHDYNSVSREGVDLNDDVFRHLSPRSNYTPNRGSQELSSSRLQQDQGRAITELGASESRSLNKECCSCKGLIMQGNLGHENNDSAEVLKVSASLLNNTILVLTRFLPEVRGVIREGSKIDLSSTADCPPIQEAGLKRTLDWFLDRIQHVNDLAKKLTQHESQGSSQGIERDFTKDRLNVHYGLENIMKRKINVVSGDAQRPRDDPEEANTDAKLHTRRRSVATTLPGTGEFLSTRNNHDHHSSHSSQGGPSQRVQMNPPPPPTAPNRQLPSPPGRSLTSPTSLNFPSPSTSSYGSSSQPSSHLPPSGLHHSSLSSYLPPIGPAHPPDAHSAHTAALQHEVSVQKIALSSLQGEHNKLLAAFSRSQTRASALENKHSVSDTEIISLTEEKLRLQSQVVELERDVEDLARSREEFRQAAVQEGAQYVEIVKRASRLEEVAGEERKGWNMMKLEMEQRIEALRGGSSRMDVTNPSAFPRLSDNVNTSASSINAQSEVKMDPTNGIRPTPHPKIFQRESNQDLEEEIRRLRNRCAEVESALQAVRQESLNMESIVEALGLAGKSILERADRTLAGS